MLRSTLRKLSRALTSTTRRSARPMTRRASLAVEGLEDRLVLSAASPTGSTMHAMDEGPEESITFAYGKLGVAYQSQQITFSADSSPSTLGQHTMGAGAGKAKFNEFEITKTTDKASPLFFKNTPTKHSNSASPPR